MSKTIRVFSILSLLFWNLEGFSQVVYPDFGMWNTISIEKKINKKVSVSIDQEFRLKENLYRMNLFYTNIRVIYKFLKKI